MLTIRTTPGKRFTDGEIVTNAKLNLLGVPVNEIDGTVETEDIEDEALTIAKTSFENVDSPAGSADAHRGASRLPVGDVVAGGPSVDVRYYGAKGDGVTDDTAAINLAIDAVMDAGGGEVLFPFGSYLLATFTETDSNVKAHLVANGTAKIALRGLGGAVLKAGTSPTAGYLSAILRLRGALSEAVVTDLEFQNTAVVAVAYGTIGIHLLDSGSELRNVTVRDCVFRDLSRGIFGGSDGLLVDGNRFVYSVGMMSTVANDYTVGVYAHLTATQRVRNWRIINNEWDGCEASSVVATRPADGLVRGTGMGWTVKGNRIRHAWGTAIELTLRDIAGFGGQSWASAPRPCVVSENTIDFEDVAGETSRVGKGILICEPHAVVTGNVIRNAHVGINLLNTDYDTSNDSGTRMRDIAVTGNVITLASDLKVDEAATIAANVRAGILAKGFGRGVVSNNSVTFTGVTSAALTSEYWRVSGIDVLVCDDLQVSGNRVGGAVGRTATDLLWLCGVSLEGCRFCEVDGNYLRHLNIGVNAGWETYVNAPEGVEFGETRMEGTSVVWPLASCAYNHNGTLTPATLLKHGAPSEGVTWRKQRTSFLCTSAMLGGAAAWVRVASFAGTTRCRVRVWTTGAGADSEVVELSLAYISDGVSATSGGLVLTSRAGVPGTTKLVRDARLCMNNAMSDGRQHFDLYVTAVAATTRVWVEIEGASISEGIWSEPAQPANTAATWTEENATGLETLLLTEGVGMSGGNWDQPHLTLGVFHLWMTAAGVLRWKSGAPTSEGDGTAV